MPTSPEPLTARGNETSNKASADAGRLLDAETGAPISYAAVFQIAWRAQLKNLEDKPRAVRWTTTDASGNFRFTSRFLGGRVGSSARTSFEVYHPDYGILQVTARETKDGELHLPLLRRYNDADRLRRVVWERGLSCPADLPESYCLHLCRTLIGQEQICRDAEMIRGTKGSVPKGFSPPTVGGD